MAAPKEIQSDEKRVRVLWTDGHRSVYTNKRLRDECPCAVCKGERGILGELYMPATKATIPEDVRVVRYTMVGRYAVSFTWSDGHATGIYPFDYLFALCECDECSGKKAQATE
jgi:DUF971 family protein